MAENGDKSVNPDGLAQAAAIAAKDGPAPVHLWNPPYCGEMDLTICADGTWLPRFARGAESPVRQTHSLSFFP